MTTIKINGGEFKKAEASKKMQEIASRFNLEVEAFIEPNWDGYGKSRKVYRFNGGFMASFDALEAEVKGYHTDPSWGKGFLVADR